MMDYQDAKIKSRPAGFIKNKYGAGAHKLNNCEGRDGHVYLPRDHDGPFPLLIVLHGAGGKSSQMLEAFKDFADQNEIALFIPESRKHTWDFIRGGYGEDVEFIDKSLEKLFNEFTVDPDHIGIAGFSDGASYALSLGLTNGDFFSAILAFTPGFMAPPTKENFPAIFISHGTEDHVLNIDLCSRRLVPALKKSGHVVTYKEFNGPHVLTDEILEEGLSFFLDHEKNYNKVNASDVFQSHPLQE